MYASIRKLINLEDEFKKLLKIKKQAESHDLYKIDRAPGSGISGDSIAHQQGVCRCDGDGELIITGSIKNSSKSSKDHPYFYVIKNWIGSKSIGTEGLDYVTFIIDSSDHRRYTHPGGIQIAENVLAIGIEDYIDSEVSVHTDRSVVKFYNIGNEENIFEITNWGFSRSGKNKIASAIGFTKTIYGQWILAVRGNNEIELYAFAIEAPIAEQKFKSCGTITFDSVNKLKNFQGMNLFWEKNPTTNKDKLFLIGGPDGSSTDDKLFLYEIILHYNENLVDGIDKIVFKTEVHLYSSNNHARFKYGVGTFVNEMNHFEVYSITMHVDNGKIGCNIWNTGTTPKEVSE